MEQVRLCLVSLSDNNIRAGIFLYWTIVQITLVEPFGWVASHAVRRSSLRLCKALKAQISAKTSIVIRPVYWTVGYPWLLGPVAPIV